MLKIKMLLLVFQIDGLLKGKVHRKTEYLEMKKVLDLMRNKILETRSLSPES
jgi:hypothetical protein